MASRKRARQNPSNNNSTDTLPSASPSPLPSPLPPAAHSTGAASPAPKTSSHGMSPTQPGHPNAPATAPSRKDQKTRRTNSWYASWPRLAKSSASTQVARENIMGATRRSKAAADFSRFDTGKKEASIDPNQPPTETLHTIAAADTRSPQNESATPVCQPETANIGVSPGDTIAAAEPDATRPCLVISSTTEETGSQAPAASTGWLSWLSRPTAQEQSEPTNESTENHQNAVDTTESTEPQDPQVQLPIEVQEPNKPTGPWFSFWYSSASPALQENAENRSENGAAIVDENKTKEDEAVTLHGPPAPSPLAPASTPAPVAAPATAQPSAGSTWAFWSRDTAPHKTGEDGASTQQGELAVLGEGSEASLKVSNVEVDEENSNKKGPQTKAAQGRPSKKTPVKKFERGRTKPVDIDESPTAQPSIPVPDSDATVKNPSSKPAATSAHKVLAPNLLLPSFKSTYRMKENPSILKQIAQLLLRTQQRPADHVFLTKETPAMRKAIAIGVHGLFPASYLRPMIGQPTGTSIRFATHCAEAIRRWTERNGLGNCEIEKVALEGEGKIADRVDNLWKLLLNWIEHIRNADLVMLACHSQGVPVGIMLLAKLIDLGVITNCRIGVCAMAGVSLGPFPDYKSGMGMLMGTAAELWQFADPGSEISKRYEHALKTVVEYGARITYVGSIDDQLVPLQSALYGPACHPHIYRAVFIDGRIHASDFIAHLVGFALKLRNLGISDHGLIRELSVPLAGSLYSGEGHSRLYDDGQVYDLAISHTLETTSTSGVPCQIQKHEGLTSPNPYVLPWIMRGLLEEDFVKTELSHETAELLKQFDDWTPTTKALKDVKYRLEAVRSKL
ncbi:hypothetical protein SAMD00023353_3700420 [Rosellinia necatrix]|uniref:YMC020W-like alpha/beta hydrolase domain-containing protein n=1 Tax=Rosellinia necatrix TaxID=77044 RepID=A0A1W2TLX1_ROSNE|nr:hypothetical protein SAMD00023353_3700420 [Rosellinia necatrix]